MDYSYSDGAWWGVSTGTKPDGIGQDGVPCVEIDTGKVYLWSEDAQDWVLQ